MADGDLVAILLALNSSFLFALSIQFSRIGLRHTDPSTGVLVEIGTSTALHWLLSPFFVEARFWLMPALLLFAAIGLFRPAVSARLARYSTRTLGPTLTSTLAGTSPFFGVALGVLALGERLSPALAVGTVGIVAGVMLLSWRGRATRDWPLWAVLLPLGAALIRALANLVAKIGMVSLPSPFFVGLVGYTVSLAVTLAATRRLPVADIIGNKGCKWFMLTGVINSVSVFSLNLALTKGTLVVVSPILACSPVFALLLGKLVFGEETIDRRIVLTMLLVVPSVVLITLAG